MDAVSEMEIKRNSHKEGRVYGYKFVLETIQYDTFKDVANLEILLKNLIKDEEG